MAKPQRRDSIRKVRKCLTCGKDFRSEGKFNRRCKRCRNSSLWQRGRRMEAYPNVIQKPTPVWEDVFMNG